MRIRLLSDLHLEFAPWVCPAARQDVVVLAGDIHNALRGIDWAAEQFDCPVVYVPGNHEYDFTDLARLREAFAQTHLPPHVHLLDNAVVIIGGVRFVGTTLWTDFALDGDPAKAMEDAARCMSDYARIHHAGMPLVPPDTLALHRQARSWLRQALAQPFDGKTVVVSHHLPLRESVAPKFKASPANPAFASNLSELLRDLAVALWCHGHTHCSRDYQAGATRVACNPRGYVEYGREENLEFDPSLVIEV